MMFGGTNFGDWAAARITTSYDYDAPIREAGGVGPRYQAVSALGHLVAEHGDRMTRTSEEAIEIVRSVGSGYFRESAAKR